MDTAWLPDEGLAEMEDLDMGMRGCPAPDWQHQGWLQALQDPAMEGLAGAGVDGMLLPELLPELDLAGDAALLDDLLAAPALDPSAAELEHPFTNASGGVVDRTRPTSLPEYCTAHPEPHPVVVQGAGGAQQPLSEEGRWHVRQKETFTVALRPGLVGLNGQPMHAFGANGKATILFRKKGRLSQLVKTETFYAGDSSIHLSFPSRPFAFECADPAERHRKIYFDSGCSDVMVRLSFRDHHTDVDVRLLPEWTRCPGCGSTRGQRHRDGVCNGCKARHRRRKAGAGGKGPASPPRSRDAVIHIARIRDHSGESCPASVGDYPGLLSLAGDWDIPSASQGSIELHIQAPSGMTRAEIEAEAKRRFKALLPPDARLTVKIGASEDLEMAVVEHDRSVYLGTKMIPVVVDHGGAELEEAVATMEDMLCGADSDSTVTELALQKICFGSNRAQIDISFSMGVTEACLHRLLNDTFPFGLVVGVLQRKGGMAQHSPFSDSESDGDGWSDAWSASSGYSSDYAAMEGSPVPLRRTIVSSGSFVSIAEAAAGADWQAARSPSKHKLIRRVHPEAEADEAVDGAAGATASPESERRCAWATAGRGDRGPAPCRPASPEDARRRPEVAAHAAAESAASYRRNSEPLYVNDQFASECAEEQIRRRTNPPPDATAAPSALLLATAWLLAKNVQPSTMGHGHTSTTEPLAVLAQGVRNMAINLANTAESTQPTPPTQSRAAGGHNKAALGERSDGSDGSDGSEDEAAAGPPSKRPKASLLKRIRVRAQRAPRALHRRCKPRCTRRRRRRVAINVRAQSACACV